MSVRKLDEETVQLIRDCDDERKRLIAEADKLNRKRLSEKFDVSLTVISNICNYVSYSDCGQKR